MSHKPSTPAPNDLWTFEEAKARLSELIAKARAGSPQQIILRGHAAVLVVDPKRFDISRKPTELSPKPKQERTMAGFIEESKKYCGVLRDEDFRSKRIGYVPRPLPVFDDDET